MSELVQHVAHELRRASVHPEDLVIVAASGGCDSTVLLNLVHACGNPMVVAHVNHQTRGAESEGDGEAVRAWAQAKGVRFELLVLESGDLSSGPQGFQGEARKARLAWFEDLRLRHNAAAVLTGHHADDQAETWLLHAMRSKDPLSVRGMALREGHVVRPLLQRTREELEHEAVKQGWTWREDASNASPSYLRNRVRNEVLPLLEQLRPGTLAHVRALAGRAAALFPLLESMLEAIRHQFEMTPGTWDVAAMKHHPLGQEVFCRALQNSGWTEASASQAWALVNSQPGRMVRCGSSHVIRERAALLVLEDHELAGRNPFGNSQEVVPGQDGTWSAKHGTVTWRPHPCPSTFEDLDLKACWIPDSWLPVTLRVWQEGDRLQPFGMKGHTRVSDVLTQAKIPHTLRPHALVMVRQSDDCLLWVVGLKLAEQARLDLDQMANESGISFSFEPPPL